MTTFDVRALSSLRSSGNLVDGALTAKNVPGRNIIVTSAMDLMCRESLLVASAISTLVSPCAFSHVEVSMGLEV